MIRVNNIQFSPLIGKSVLGILLMILLLGLTYSLSFCQTNQINDTLFLKSINKVGARHTSSSQHFSLNPTQLKEITEDRLQITQLEFALSGQKVLIPLQEQHLFGPEFQVLNGDNQPVPYKQGRYYQYASADTMATLAIFSDHMLAAFSFGSRTYSLGLLSSNSTTYELRLNRIPSNLKTFGACHTSDELNAFLLRRVQGSAHKRVSARGQLPPIDLYFELDRYTFREFGSSISRTMDFFTGVFNGVAQIYLREGITVRIHSVKVWDRSDPFQDASATAALSSFKFYLRNNVKEQAWDAAMLLSRYSTDDHPAPHGGVAGLDALCDGSKRHGYANILGSYKDFPDYSWTVFVITHELGHIFGSPHAHNCNWPGGAIDNCYCSEGNCDPGPDPGTLGGTIMSYCYLNAPFSSSCRALPDTPNPGVNFLNGFGTYPGNLIRASIADKRCLEGKVQDTLANLRALDSFQVVQHNQVFQFKNILINNFGLAFTDSFDLTLMLADDLVDERTYQQIAQLKLPGLGPGQSVNIDTSFALEQVISKQNWVWQIDANNLVAEWNEGDNYIYANRITQDLSPDLLVAGFGMLETFPHHFLIRNIEITNIGGRAVSGARIDFYLSVDPLFSREDFLIGSTSLPYFEAFESHVINFSQYKGSLLLPTGNYYLAYRLELEDTEEITENNQGFLQVEESILLDWTWLSLFKGRFR